jgi:outer membrane lipoprotein-sorting protein
LVAPSSRPADASEGGRAPRATRLSIALLLGAAVASQQASAAARATDGKTQFDQALARLAHIPRFQFVETVRVTGRSSQSVWTQIRFLAPNRMRMIVRTLAPERKQFETLQVGRVRCQAPPGVCFRTLPPKPADLVRSFLRPRLRVRYRSETNPATDTTAVTMTASTGARGQYKARLVIDTVTGAPQSFSMTAGRGGHVSARQTATFDYKRHFTIRLPRKARVPKP